MYHISRLRASRSATTRALAQSGFTLIELMVTVAVAAILMAIAAPSFTSLINSNRLASAANEFVGTLQTARSEAVRLNTRAIVCRSTDGVSCATGGAWSAWIVLVDATRDGTADDVMRVGGVKTPVQVSTSSNIQSSSITFYPDGFGRMADGSLLAANIDVCIPTDKPKENIRRVSIITGSRISTASLSGDGACAGPDNPSP